MDKMVSIIPLPIRGFEESSIAETIEKYNLVCDAMLQLAYQVSALESCYTLKSFLIARRESLHGEGEVQGAIQTTMWAYTPSRMIPILSVTACSIIKNIQKVIDSDELLRAAFPWSDFDELFQAVHGLYLAALPARNRLAHAEAQYESLKDSKNIALSDDKHLDGELFLRAGTKHEMFADDYYDTVWRGGKSVRYRFDRSELSLFRPVFQALAEAIKEQVRPNIFVKAG